MARVIKVVIEMRGQSKVDKNLRDTTLEIKKLALEQKRSNKVARDAALVTKAYKAALYTTAGSLRNVGSAVSIARREIISLKTAQNQASKSASKASFIQKRLTASYLAGNLAARGIAAAMSNLAGAMRFGIAAGINFEFVMTKISAISGVTGANLVSLESTIKNIASQSPKTSTEVARAALEMSKMGLAGKDLEDSLAGVVGLSVALDESVDAVGRTLVNVKNVFQKDASEITKIADMLFTTLGNSALNLEKFGTAFSFAGASARLAGVDFSQLTGLMGVLADNGIKASTVGTQLRQVFTRLDDPTSNVSKLLGEQSIKTRGLSQTLRILNLVIKNSGDAKKLFGQRAIGVIDILTKNISKIEELTEKTRSLEKSTQDAAEALGGTLLGNLKKVASAFELLFINVGDSGFLSGIFGGLAGHIRRVAQSMDGVVQKSEFIKKFVDEARMDQGLGGDLSFKGIVLGTSSEDVKKWTEDAEMAFSKMYGGPIVFLEKQIKGLKQLETSLDKISHAGSALRGVDIPFNTSTGNFDFIAAMKGLKSVQNQMAQQFVDNIKEEQNLSKINKQKEAIALAEKLGTAEMVKKDRLSELFAQKELKREEAKKQEKKDANPQEEAKLKIVNSIARQAELDLMPDDRSRAESELEQQKIDNLAKIGEEEKFAAQRLAVEDAFMVNKERLTKEFDEREAQAIVDRRVAFISATAGMTDAFSGLFAVRTANAVKAAEAEGKSEEEINAIRKKGFKQQQLFQSATTTMNTAAAIMQVWADPTMPSTIAKINMTTLVGATGLAQLGAINTQKFAKGFDGVVNQPTNITVGEEGPEEVLIRPRGSSNTGKGGSGQGMTIIIQGDVHGEEMFLEKLRKGNEEIERRSA